MIRDPEEVRQALRDKVRWGYRPKRNRESSLDHSVDWFALTEEEFVETEREARKAGPADDKPANTEGESGTTPALLPLADSIAGALGDCSAEQLHAILRDALGTTRFVDDLAELYRADPESLREKLRSLGLRPQARKAAAGAGGLSDWVCSPSVQEGPGFRISASGPAFDQPFRGAPDAREQVESEWRDHCESEPGAFLAYYRTGLDEYVAKYGAETSPKIRTFLEERFGTGGPRYMLTVGIGANEQFWHFPQRLHQRGSHDVHWLIADNPKDLGDLPPDASADNTVVLEFSRSGKTQETVKFDEFLDPAVPRIVFANSGPLAELGARNKALCLEVPEEIPGRFSKNLSPVLLAPLDILGLPIQEYWGQITRCIEQWDLCDPSSPPAALARYLRAALLLHGANHLYVGCNDEVLLASCDELVQFWNEGVNKGSDFPMSRYFGLPRDSHLNIEGILANHATKAGIFLLRRGGDERFQHPLRAKEPRPINSSHAGLSVADVDYALARANAEHFGSRMPTVTIEVDEPDLFCSAILSQLWTDTVYVYSKMIRVNPGSNPEVREVRDRSERLLASFARSKDAPS